VSITTNNGRVQGNTCPGNVPFGIPRQHRVATIFGAVDAETSNGRITVRDARGTVTLKSLWRQLKPRTSRREFAPSRERGHHAHRHRRRHLCLRPVSEVSRRKRISGNLTVENSNGLVAARNVKGDAGVKTSFAGVTLNRSGAGSLWTIRRAISGGHASRSSGCRDISLKTFVLSIRVRIPEGWATTSRQGSFGRIFLRIWPVTSTAVIGGDTLNGTIVQAVLPASAH